MVASQNGPFAIFGRSWIFLIRNPAIVVPGILAAGFTTFVSAVIASPDASSSDVQIVVHGTSLLLAHVFATVLAIAFTTGMADAAWRTGRGRFADGIVAFRRESGHVFIAVIALLALGLVAAVAASFSHGISLGIYAYCCVYTMPSAVVGERPGLVAIGESTRIAFQRPVATLAILIGVSALALAFGSGAEFVQMTPYVGSLLGAVVIQAVIAYATLVLVGEYRIARQMETLP